LADGQKDREAKIPIGRETDSWKVRRKEGQRGKETKRQIDE
jgi:hypothetical protein